jgi:hypothetical protein
VWGRGSGWGVGGGVLQGEVDLLNFQAIVRSKQNRNLRG